MTLPSYNIEQFTDRHGLISCYGQPCEPFKAPTTGNGVLFSAVYSALTNFKFTNYEAIRRCVIDGILWRNPEKEQGFDSHDNYTAFAYAMHSEDCEKLFWACAKKFFMVGGNPMIRFPQVWAMLFLSAYNYTVTKVFMAPFFLVLFLLQKPENKDNKKGSLGDTSGLQLQFVIVKYLDMMYPIFKPYERWRKKLLAIAPQGEWEFFRIYYGPLHPISIEAAKMIP